jgi:hypothetical protein
LALRSGNAVPMVRGADPLDIPIKQTVVADGIVAKRRESAAPGVEISNEVDSGVNAGVGQRQPARWLWRDAAMPACLCRRRRLLYRRGEATE